MALNGSKIDTNEASSDKRCITGTFGITTQGKFLPVHLIYKLKSVQSLRTFKFLQGFCLSANEKEFSNRVERMKYLEEVIVSYFITKKCPIESLDQDQKPPVIMDVFTGLKTSEVLDSYKSHNICVINVPANVTKYYQQLDLTVN